VSGPSTVPAGPGAARLRQRQERRRGCGERQGAKRSLLWICESRPCRQQGRAPTETLLVLIGCLLETRVLDVSTRLSHAYYVCSADERPPSLPCSRRCSA